jgi:hypothetical protein
MSAYIKLSTLEYPRHEGDIRLEHPEILDSQTGDAFPCPPTYAVVNRVERPEYDSFLQMVYELPPVQTETGWVQAWAVRNLTAAEMESAQIYNGRDSIPVERI